MAIVIINPNSTASMTEAMLAQARRAAEASKSAQETSKKGRRAVAD